MADTELGTKLKSLVAHYGEAIGHVVGGGALFLVILTTVFIGSAAADWFTQGKTVDPWITGAIFGIKFAGLVLDGFLLMAVGYSAIKAALK